MSKIFLKQYIRDTAPRYATDDFGNVYELVGKPIRIGVIVSTGPGKMGFSVISPEENLTEKETYSHIVMVHDKPKQITKMKRKWTSKKIWDFGTELATSRAEGNSVNPRFISNSVKRQIAQFEERMSRYYK
jgi:hypothetical protein